jgi:hypothetical protein
MAWETGQVLVITGQQVEKDEGSDVHRGPAEFAGPGDRRKTWPADSWRPVLRSESHKWT